MKLPLRIEDIKSSDLGFEILDADGVEVSFDDLVAKVNERPWGVWLPNRPTAPGWLRHDDGLPFWAPSKSVAEAALAALIEQWAEAELEPPAPYRDAVVKEYP